MSSAEALLVVNEEQQDKKGLSRKQRIAIGVGLVGFLLLVAIGLTTWIVLHPAASETNQLMVDSVRNKFFATPTYADEPQYQQKGEWVILSNKKEGTIVQSTVGTKHTIKLNYTNPGEFYVKEKSRFVEHLDMEMRRESPSELAFRIVDSEENIFSIPHEFPFPHTKDSYKVGDGEDVYGYEMMAKQQLRVFRKSGDKQINIFNTGNSKFIFTHLYTEFMTTLDTPYVWGLGDRRTMNYLLESGFYTIWNRDQSSIDPGHPAAQIYGTHPVWMHRDEEGFYHIIVLRTANPMEVEYVKGESLRFKVVGGIVELKFIFGGANPREAIEKYHRYVNGWALHPFWSSGWHQSRWGYKSSQELLEVVANYTKYNLPLDVMWSDLDYMDSRKDFTLDVANFKPEEMKKMMDKENPEGVEWVPIIDPGIAVDSDCARRGLEANIFIQSTKSQQHLANGTNSLIGWVWPGKTFFPDFNHPNASETWDACFSDFFSHYDFYPSGIWIDMNEYASFVDGEVDPAAGLSRTQLNALSSSEIDLQDLPFNPQGDTHLETHTISISAIHYNEDDAVYLRQQNGNLTELNVHSLNGFLEGIATKNSLERTHKTSLTFILSRSSFMGSGRFVQHWLGDNQSTWEWLASSVSAIFGFNLYGIPFVGDDVCGFGSDTNDQLCARWIQLAAFYPFARSHDAFDARIQEPWTFQPYVVEATRKSLNLRYSLLKFYYAQFVTKYDSSLGAGVGSIYDPLFYTYSNDEATLTIDRQFSIGDSLFVVPVVEKQSDESLNYTVQKYYVPQGATWYEWTTGQVVKGPLHTEAKFGFEDPSLVFINEGRIVPTSKSTNINRLRNLPSSIGLSIALQAADSQGYSAHGSYLALATFDEQNVEERCWSSHSTCSRDVVVVGHQNGNTLTLTFTNTPHSQADASEPIVIDELTIYGIVVDGATTLKKVVPVQLSSLQSIWTVQVEL